MKKINLLLLIVSLLTIGLLSESCDKADPCESVICENNGTCNDGFCECPAGYTGTNCERFDSTQVQFLLDEGISPKALFDGGISLDSLYGKNYEGGLIFYLNTINGTGMVAATEDQISGSWGCYGIVVGGLGADIGTGGQNTMDILADCMSSSGNVIAAKRCDVLIINDKSDWFLPSKDELNLMYSNLHVKGHGGFDLNDSFWCSTEADGVNAWYQNFGSGFQMYASKEGSGHVRAARAF